jgi:O-antigen/teichoic acid export membrane protein
MSYLLLSICQLLMDPICKILIGRFSTLETVAVFDLANKVTSQARIIYQAIAQSILPLVSREQVGLDADLHAKLLRRNKFISRCSFYTMGVVVLLSGHLAIFTLGHVQEDFIADVIILALANALNTVGLIGYYIEVGSGHLRRLLGVFTGMATGNVILSVGLGLVMGAPGIVLGYGCALAVAGLACARALIPGLTAVFRWLTIQASLELMLFFANCLIIWFTMIWLNYSDPLLCTALILGMLAITVAMFLFRERAELSVQVNRLTGKIRT